jgi:RNA polymerase sigma factor (sigma-70 family)
MLAVQMASPHVPVGPGPIPGFFQETEALRPVVRAVAAAILRQSRMHPDVEDVTHETLRRALEGRARLREGEPVRPWLLGIARHVALDALRRRGRERRLVTESATDGSEEAALDRVPDSAPLADDRLDRARRAALVRDAIQKLPEDHRKALMMFHVEGMAYREIGDRLGVPMGTVCTWISRGRRAVALALDEHGAKT